MKVLLLLLLGCASTVQAVPLYKGYFEVDQIVRTRLRKPGDGYSLTRAVLPDPLYRMLGGYGSQVVANEFESGTPNPANLTLWSMVFEKLGADLASACGNPAAASQVLHPDVVLHLAKLCQWPAAGSEDALLDLWTDLMQFDAPMEEFEAWRDELKYRYRDSKAAALIRAAVPAAYLNPYFLMSP